MAARTLKTAKKEKVTPKRTSIKKSTPVSNKPVSRSESPARKSRLASMTMKQKALLAGGVLLLAFLIYSGKDLFVAATVNGLPITRLEVVRELEKQGGQQVLDSIINEKIIIQEARKANITASNDEMNAKIDEFKGQLEAQGQDYATVLEMQGVSEADFKKQVEIQIYLEKLLSDRVSVTDEEVSSFLETNKDFLPKGMSDEEYKNMATEELKQQKLSTEFSTWLSEVKANSDIKYFLEY